MIDFNCIGILPFWLFLYSLYCQGVAQPGLACKSGGLEVGGSNPLTLIFLSSSFFFKNHREQFYKNVSLSFTSGYSLSFNAENAERFA